jgi:hypothetical protein
VLSFGAAGAAVYGGSYVPTAGGGGSGSPVMLTIDSSSASVCSLHDGVVHFDHVGVCTVTATQAGADGFAPAVPVQQSVTVTPAALTITADAKSMTYGGGSVPALTATFAGLVGDDTPAAVTGLALATASATSHAGTYAITAGGATSPDYAITFVPGVLTIVRAPLTVTAVDAVRLYDVANPVFAATATGLVNGDTLGSAFGSSLAGSSPAVPVSNVGTYPITFTGVAPDYSVTFVGGTLTLKPMPTTVTFTSSATQPAGPTYLSVHVVEAVGGAPVRGGSVAFTAGSLSSTVATSAAGVATTSLAIPNGVVTVTAAYSGANYVASSASQGLTSFLSTQFVVWGGNSPAGVVAGGTYRFWGSAWKDQVTAGAYGAGDSFKGYAEVVAADGRSFTARTGSSGSAPASIARYISVLVSTSMTKAGSTISGNVVQRVVLRVDDLSTYKPSAGGTTAGVLVATVA